MFLRLQTVASKDRIMADEFWKKKKNSLAYLKVSSHLLPGD
jgi:hypothetical protein